MVPILKTIMCWCICQNFSQRHKFAKNIPTQTIPNKQAKKFLKVHNTLQ